MDVTLSARLNVPPLTRWIFVPDRLNVIGELQSLTVLNEMEFTAADKIHGLFAAVLAVFLISLVIRSMPILPLWVMPSLVVASNHPRAPCKSGMAIMAATIPSRVMTIIISMRVKPLVLRIMVLVLQTFFYVPLFEKGGYFSYTTITKTVKTWFLIARPQSNKLNTFICSSICYSYSNPFIAGTSCCISI